MLENGTTPVVIVGNGTNSSNGKAAILVLNAKTGALMPCPGTDKEFYKSIPALSVTSPKVNQTADSQASLVTATSSPKSIAAPVECKPQLHQKSGSLMPCPAP